MATFGIILNSSARVLENLIENSDAIANLLDEQSRFVIWISNAFYNNSLYFIMTPKEASAKYSETINAIKKKLRIKAFRLINSNTIIFGENMHNPIGLITDGGVQSKNLDDQGWIEI